MDLSTVRTTGGGSVRVVVDAMGGDHAPLEIVVGTLSWARAHPDDKVLLVGIPERITEVAGGPVPANVEIVPASQIVGMDESPALALKSKKDSSIMVAMDLIKQGRADALVTAGHTGAGMAAAVLKLGRLPGVDRPALAVQMVTETGPFVLLDIGANIGLDRPQPLPVRPHGLALRGAGAGRRETRGSRCSRSARRRARATGRSSRRPSCSTRTAASTSSATSRAATWSSTWRTSPSATPWSAT